MIVLVGEDNPHGSDPRYALYHEPRNCAGDRLRRLIFGIRVNTYFRRDLFERGNLCARKWNMAEARERAARVHAERPDATIAMFGRKVAAAFAFATSGVALTAFGQQNRMVSLPHPSGRNQAWNDTDAIPRARAILRQLHPEVPWGELDNNAPKEEVDIG